jgi:very-short-patch-repair endonuclease
VTSSSPEGARVHRPRAAFECDRRKDAALAVAGFRVLRFTWRRLEQEPERLVAAVTSA